LENVVIKFIADTDGLKPAIDQLKLLGKITEEDAKLIAEINAEQKEFLNTINRTTTEAGKLNAEIEDLGKTMSNDVIGKAADELSNFTKESNQAVQGAKSLKAELRELKKQIASGDFTGEELRQMTKRAAELDDHLGDVNERIKSLASDTKYIDALTGAMRGVAAAASVAAGASALFGSESEELAKATQKAQAAMALLAGVQELSALATTENATKTMFLDTAQKLATVSSNILGKTITTSMAAATMGVSLLVGAVVAFMSTMEDAETDMQKFNKSLAEMDRTQTAVDVIKARSEMIKSSLNDEAKARIDAKAEMIKRERMFTEEANKKLRTLDQNFNALASEEKISAYGRYMRKREEVETKLAQDLKLIQISYQEDVANIDEKYAEKEEKRAEKKAAKKVQIAKKSAFDALFAEAEADAHRQALMDDFTNRYMDMLHKQDLADKEANAQFEENFKDMLDQKESYNMDWWLRYIETEDNFNAREEEKRKKRIDDWKAASIDAAQSVSAAIFEITNRDITLRYDAEISAIDKRTASLLENENLTAAQRKKIEDKAQRDIAKIKTEQFKRQKAADIIQATINTALAVSRALPNIPAAVATGIAGAATIAVIASQPIPQFAKGTEKFISEGTGTQDRGLAWLSHGERVVPTSVNNDYFEALSAIQNRAVDPTLANNIMTALSNGTFAAGQNEKMDVNKLAQALKGTNKQTTVNINIDEQGFMKFVQKGNSHREYLNKKFRYEA
jgi:hypothetical protein